MTCKSCSMRWASSSAERLLRKWKVRDSTGQACGHQRGHCTSACFSRTLPNGWLVIVSWSTWEKRLRRANQKRRRDSFASRVGRRTICMFGVREISQRARGIGIRVGDKTVKELLLISMCVLNTPKAKQKRLITACLCRRAGCLTRIDYCTTDGYQAIPPFLWRPFEIGRDAECRRKISKLSSDNVPFGNVFPQGVDSSASFVKFSVNVASPPSQWLVAILAQLFLGPSHARPPFKFLLSLLYLLECSLHFSIISTEPSCSHGCPCSARTASRSAWHEAHQQSRFPRWVRGGKS